MTDDIQDDYIQQINSTIKDGNAHMLAGDDISAISDYKSALKSITEYRNTRNINKENLSVIQKLELDAILQLGLCYCRCESADPDGIYLTTYVDMARKIGMDDSKIFFLGGMALNRLGNLDASIGALKSAVENDPNNPLYLYNLALFCKKKGDNWYEYQKSAEEIFPEIATLNPGKPIYLIDETSIINKQSLSNPSKSAKNNEPNIIDAENNNSDTVPSSSVLSHKINNSENKYEDDWDYLDDDVKNSNGKKIGIAIIIVVLIIGAAGVFIAFSGNMPSSNPSYENINSVSVDTVELSATPSNIAAGSLNVMSSPINAEVYLNGEYKGKTPIGINNLAPGTYTLKLSKSDDIKHYVDEVMTVTINSGAATKKDIMLTLGGEMYVRTDPKGASIYLDAEYKGLSPLTIEGIPPGTHVLQATHDGYNSEHYTFESGIGSSNSVSMFLIAKTY